MSHLIDKKCIFVFHWKIADFKGQLIFIIESKKKKKKKGNSIKYMQDF